MKDYYTVGAHFKGSSKLYTYKVPKGIEIVTDEHIVVNTMTGLTLVKVKEVHIEPQDTTQGVDYKYIAYLLLPVVVPDQRVPENAKTRL